MYITYKAADYLLSNNYRPGFVNDFIQTDIGDAAFRGSLLYAHKVEDFKYLSSFVSKREVLNAKYLVFHNIRTPRNPILLKVERDKLTLREFAILYKQCDLHISEFITVVEASAGNLQLDEKEQVANFNKEVEILENIESLIGNNDGDEEQEK